MLLIRFAHFLGQAMWIGGALTAMVVAIGVRGEVNAIRAAAFRQLYRAHTLVIAPGALLTLGTGILMTMQYAGGDMSALGSPGLWIMQGAGLIAGLMVLFVSLPTASRLNVLSVPSEEGDLPPGFERLRKRQALVSSVAGALAVLSLFAGVVIR